MIEIDGYTRTCGLLGNPVEHTMSPPIHNYLAEALGQNLVYMAFHVEHGYVGDAVAGAFAMNFLGLNVTVPYKTEVIPFLKDIDPLAERIGAVNTLVRKENGFKGYNTDMPGLYRAMVSDGVTVEGKKVLILGAGGVARAVAMLLADKKAGEIILLNRTLEKAEAIANEVNGFAGYKIARAMQLSEYSTLPEGEQFLAIQATNVGMFPHNEDAVITDKAFYEKIHTGYDLIYNPRDTRFMQLVRESGGKSYNGLKMLLYQGIIAYELWNDLAVSEEHAANAYVKMVEAMDRMGK